MNEVDYRNAVERCAQNGETIQRHPNMWIGTDPGWVETARVFHQWDWVLYKYRVAPEPEKAAPEKYDEWFQRLFASGFLPFQGALNGLQAAEISQLRSKNDLLRQELQRMIELMRNALNRSAQ